MELFETGTSTPVVIDSFSFTIDDLDDFSVRTEALSTADAVGYTVNSPTNVAVTFSGSTFTAMGSTDQNSGDPEGAVRFHFENKSTIVLSYNSTFQEDAQSAYHHDGSTNLIFPNPDYTPVLPEMPRLYYSYDFSNEKPEPVNMNFLDELPEGLIWDTSFVPVTTNGLSVNVVYSNNNRNATITEFSLPPGQSKLTLSTLQTQMGGDIANEATLTPGAGEAVAVVTTPESTAEIDLPHAGGILEDISSSPVMEYAVFVTDTHFSLNGNNAGVLGNVGIANSVNQNLVSGGITGAYVVHPPGTGSTGNADTQPGGGGQPLSPVYQDLTEVRNSSLYLSAALASLSATQSFGTINSTQTIASTAPDGVNVISVGQVNLSGQKQLILDGEPDDYFIINVLSEMKFTGQSGLFAIGGVPGSHIVINMLPGSNELKLAGNATAYTGTFLAVQDTNTVTQSGNAAVNGTIAGRSISLSGNASVTQGTFESPD